MKILLTSNGINNKTLEKALAKLTGNKKKMKVAFIPTAGDPIKWTGTSVGSKDDKPVLIGKNYPKKSNDYKYLTGKGYKVIIADLKEDRAKLKKKLESVEMIFVGGGDVNYLVKQALKAKLDTYLGKLLKNGVIYVSISAGGGLILPEFGLSWWEPHMYLEHNGFGIVDFVAMVHQKESDKQKNSKVLLKRKKYFQKILGYPWKVYLVKDGQAVMVDGQEIKHIGPGPHKSI